MSNYQWYLKQSPVTLEKYAGQWVTIVDDHIAVAGKDVKHVLEETDKKFAGKDSLLVKIPEKKELVLA